MSDITLSFIRRSRRTMGNFINDNQTAAGLAEEALALGYIQKDPATGALVRDEQGHIVTTLTSDDVAPEGVDLQEFLEAMAGALATLEGVPPEVIRLMYRVRSTAPTLPGVPGYPA